MESKARFEVCQSLKHPKTVQSLSVQFSPDDSLLCVGGFDGQIRQYNTALGYKQSSNVISSAMTDGHDLQSPITSIRFRPRNAIFSAKNVILVSCSDGNITHWHLGSQKELHSLKDENETYCVDYSPDGKQFAAVGKDHYVRLYDEEKRLVENKMFQGTGESNAHSARIQQVKWVDENIIATAGWDYTVQIWDVREQRAVRRIYGPYVCGDALDVNLQNNMVLTGSARTSKQLQAWDLGSCELMQDIEWPKNSNVNPEAIDPSEPTDVWAAKFSPNGRFIAAGGNTDCRIFDVARDFETCGDLMKEKKFVDHCVLSCTWANDNKHVAVATGGGEVMVLQNIA